MTGKTPHHLQNVLSFYPCVCTCAKCLLAKLGQSFFFKSTKPSQANELDACKTVIRQLLQLLFIHGCACKQLLFSPPFCVSVAVVLPTRPDGLSLCIYSIQRQMLSPTAAKVLTLSASLTCMLLRQSNARSRQLTRDLVHRTSLSDVSTLAWEKLGMQL